MTIQYLELKEFWFVIHNNYMYCHSIDQQTLLQENNVFEAFTKMPLVLPYNAYSRHTENLTV